MSEHVYVVPDALIAAATELDALAMRLEVAVRSADPALDVPPPGAEEVSRLVSRYFGGLAGSFRPAAAHGVEQIRELARTLRHQAQNYRDQDTSTAVALAQGM
jgi:hypothetical protein